jgi:hypothetical protein
VEWCAGPLVVAVVMAAWMLPLLPPCCCCCCHDKGGDEAHPMREVNAERVHNRCHGSSQWDGGRMQHSSAEQGGGTIRRAHLAERNVVSGSACHGL